MSTMEATTYVNFVCQRCALPLKLAPNIAEIEEKSFQELTAIANGDDGPPNPDVSLDEALAAAIQTNNVFMPFSQSPAHELVSRRVIGPKKMQDRPPLSRSQTTADSFVVLAQQMERSSLSQNKKDSLSYRIKVANRLFDILSGNSPNDHPLCNECSEQLLEELEARIEEATQERDDYVRFLQEHEREVADDSGKSEAEYEAELQELTREEETLQAQIAEVEAQRAAVAGEAKKVTAELAELDVLEQKYWRELNTFQRQSLEFQKERDSLIVRHAHAHTQLERLKRTNVYNDTFHIWHDGHFGTINNFRLGRLPAVNVEWAEINAAWGQTALLLYTLAEKIGLQFERFRILPLGSFSKMLRLEDKALLELYGTSGLSQLKTLWYPQFDQAMVAFLDCLNQFKMHVETKDSLFRLPYKINKDKIGDVSIRTNFNSQEQWTKALKFMLTDLKWCLAWVCKIQK
eukprot:Colp12_sorted_trinity150504_noHs@19701